MSKETNETKTKVDGFISMDDPQASKQYGESLKNIYITKGSHGSFKNITSVLSAREPYGRQDYES